MSHFTRQQMYSLIWNTGVEHLAQMEGIDPEEVKLFLKKHNIPWPEQSYVDECFAKFGRMKIPRFHNDEPNRIVFEFKRTPRPEIKEQVLKNAEKRRWSEKSLRKMRKRESVPQPKMSNTAWNNFEAAYEKWKHYQGMRDFAAKIQRSYPANYEVDGRSIAEWLSWVSSELSDRDPLNGPPENIFKGYW